MAKVWHIRLSDEDRQLLEQVANAKGMDRPALVRGLIRAAHAKLRAAGEIKGT